MFGSTSVQSVLLLVPPLVARGDTVDDRPDFDTYDPLIPATA